MEKTKDLIISNDPKVLIEFSPEEITWLCDRLHEEWARTVQANSAVSSKDLQKKVQEHQEMQNRLRNRLLEKSFKQGFGHL